MKMRLSHVFLSFLLLTAVAFTYERISNPMVDCQQTATGIKVWYTNPGPCYPEPCSKPFAYDMRNGCDFYEETGEYGQLEYSCINMSNGGLNFSINFMGQCNMTNASQKPDLTVSKIDYWYDDEENPLKLFFNATITNIGSVRSVSSAPNVITGFSTFLDGTRCGALWPGESCIVTGYGYHSDNSTIKNIRCSLFAESDPHSAVDESDESNNDMLRVVLVGSSDQSIPESPLSIPDYPVGSNYCPYGCECNGNETICHPITVSPPINCGDACALNDRCVTKGTRIIMSGNNSYCNEDGGWSLQKTWSENEPMSPEQTQQPKGIIESILDFFGWLFKAIFG